MAAPAAFLALALAAVRPTLDSDLWWHLKTGELLFRGRFTNRDPFSYTAGDNPWIIHEWLSDYLMWGIQSTTDLSVLSVVAAAIIALTFAIVYQRCRPRPWPALPIVLLAAAATWSMWGARPQIVNWLGTAVFLFILEGVRRQELQARQLWWLVPLTWLWANLHSGFLVGPALLAVYLVGGVVDRRLGGAWTVPANGWHVLVAALLLSLLNPAGYRQTFFAFFTLSSSPIQSNILEWRSPDFHHPVAWLFAGVGLICILGWSVGERPAGRGRWPSVTALLLVGGSAAAGLLSARHIAIFAVVAAPYATTAAAALWARWPSRRGRLASVATAVLALALLVALLPLGQRANRLLAGNAAAVAGHFPAAAVDFIESGDLAEARIFNHYNWGGYLLWRGVTVAVDGRTELYGDDVFTRYLSVAGARPGWAATLDGWGVDYVLFPPATPLVSLLAADPAWVQVYDDGLAVIYRRAR